MRKSSRLPTRFPDGAKYVLESDGPLIRRYVELPDGRRFALRSRKAPPCCADEVSIVPPALAEAKRARRGSRLLETA